MNFAHPHYLWALLIILPLVWWYIHSYSQRYPSLRISDVTPFVHTGTPLRAYLLHALFGLRMACLACLIIIMAQPLTYDSWSKSSAEGTDIVLALDLSTSMLARDFQPNRFEAAKTIASKFVAGRESDNMGLVIFAGESLTGLPMTTDRALLSNYIKETRIGMLQDGTAIGDGLATAINRIKDGKAKSKSIILLTDGSNNTGNVAPITAAEIAKKYGIKVYTIGVGKNGEAPFPTESITGEIVYTTLPVVIDEATLQTIATTTGGKYFRATDNNTLSQIFEQINALEKSVIDVRNFSHTEDDYFPWAIAAIVLLSIELILRHTVVRTIPQ